MGIDPYLSSLGEARVREIIHHSVVLVAYQNLDPILNWCLTMVGEQRMCHPLDEALYGDYEDLPGDWAWAVGPDSIGHRQFWFARLADRTAFALAWT